MKKKLKIVVLVIVMLAGAGGYYFYIHASPDGDEVSESDAVAEEEGGEEKVVSDAVYVPLDPPLVVNITNPEKGVRFLQVSMQVLVDSKIQSDAITKHMPVIRNSLVMLLSSQPYAELSTVEGKEKIRQIALDEIKKILERNGTKEGVNSIYYTDFVMQ